MVLEKELTRIMREESKYLIPNHYETFRKTIKLLIKPFKKIKIDKVVVIETAGLFYGSIIANKLKVPLVPILKGDKIKDREKVVRREFIDYSGDKKSIEILKGSINSGERILLVDDWFDSGNTGKAAVELIEKFGGKIVGISNVFNKMKKEDETFFKRYNYHYIAKLEPESK